MAITRAKLVNEISLVRSLIFGLEDSLVSTVGLLSGIATAQVSREHIITTGIILISVEAFSMGVGSLLSENSAAEFEKKEEVALSKAFPAAMVMILSYLLGGMVPLIPYWWSEPSRALFWSIGFAVIALVILGCYSSWLFRVSLLKQVLRMSVLGGAAIAIGIIIGQLL